MRGETLAQLTEEGALSDRDVCRIGAALCEALAHAHQRGVVHRDVKPANVIVPETPEKGSGVAKLTDFGIARLHGEDVLTRTGDIVGTLAYMAPEQAEGKESGPPADLYALGLVVYEALAGVNPIRGRTPAATARRVGVRLPALERLRRDLPLELCRAIDRAVVPRPRDRGSLKDLRVALRRHAKEVDDEPGAVEAGALETVARGAQMVLGRRVELDRTSGAGEPWGELEAEPRRLQTRPSARAVAALAAGTLATVAAAFLGPQPPLAPLAIGVIVAALVGLLPRVGWIVFAIGVVTWLLATPEGTIGGHSGGLLSRGAPATSVGRGLQEGWGGLAVLAALAALPVAPMLWRTRGTWFSAPALAPLLGLLTLAGAFPAIAGQARGVLQRAALGALGLWWLLLAELLTGRTLLLGPPPDAHPARDWAPSASQAFSQALWPAVAGGALALAALWAAAAAVLPYVVRGRSAAVDLLLAAAWAAALGWGTQAIAASLGWPGQPRGLVAGAVAAGVAAVGARAWRAPPA